MSCKRLPDGHVCMDEGDWIDEAQNWIDNEWPEFEASEDVHDWMCRLLRVAKAARDVRRPVIHAGEKHGWVVDASAAAELDRALRGDDA